MTRPRALRNRRTEIGLGVCLFIASAWLMWDAYEGRGRTRPFPARLLPLP